MAARDAELAVLPEHRRVQRADSGARREASQAEARQALHAIAPDPSSVAYAGQGVTPSVLPLTHVIYRCNRYGTYIRWLNHVSVRQSGPKPVRSQWGSIMQGRIEQIGGPVELCPVSAEEAMQTGLCIMALPKELREAIVEEHVVGGTQQQKADHLQIDRTTFWRRCQAAYPKLLELMNLAAAGLPLDA